MGSFPIISSKLTDIFITSLKIKILSFFVHLDCSLHVLHSYQTIRQAFYFLPLNIESGFKTETVIIASPFVLTDCPSCSPWRRVCWNGSAGYPSCCNPARPAAPHRGRLEQKASKRPSSASGSIVVPPRKTSSAACHNSQCENSLPENKKLLKSHIKFVVPTFL